MFSFAIDFDEVLADVGAYTLAHYNLLHPQFPLEPKDITSFYWEELPQSAFQTREESILFCRSVINNQDINDIIPVHGAIDGIKKLADMGHTLHLITARHHSNHQKIQQWCEHHFGALFKSYHTLGSDIPVTEVSKGVYAKNLGITHALDDGGHNVEEYLKHDVRAYCFNAPWNKNHSLDPSIRVDSWDEFITKIYHEMNIGKYS